MPAGSMGLRPSRLLSAVVALFWLNVPGRVRVPGDQAAPLLAD